MLKKTVPIWKKEYFEDGAVWADGEAFPKKSGGREARRGRRAHLKLLFKHFSH